MSTATSDFEGTIGSRPDAMSGGVGTWSLDYDPDLSASEWAISSTVAHSGTRSGQATSSCKHGAHHLVSSLTYMVFRGYFYLTAAPTANMAVIESFNGDYSKCTYVGINTDRSLYVAVSKTTYETDVTNASASYTTSANAVPLNEWVRIEAVVDNSGANCLSQVKMWKASGAGADSSGTPDYNSGIVSGTLMGNLGDIWFGVSSADAGSAKRSFISSGQYIYTDDFAVNDTGAWIGPIASTGYKRGLGVVRY